MKKRRSKEEWMSLVSEYIHSVLNLTACCKGNRISIFDAVIPTTLL